MRHDKIIPSGWHQVLGGQVHFGDKEWIPRLAAWLPVTVNDHRQVLDLVAVIRKDGQ